MFGIVYTNHAILSLSKEGPMRKMAVLVCLMLFGAGAASAAEGCKINRLLGDVQIGRAHV